LGCVDQFDVSAEIERRVGFLSQQVVAAGRRALVLGVSGGIDSATTGRLCHLAPQRVRAGGCEATFVAVRLPYGSQVDEADAQRALAFVRADRVITADVRPVSDGVVEALQAGGLLFTDDRHRDSILANIKARQRMVVQYAIAGLLDGLVVGTDHAAEAVTGFFTKHGDGAADLTPLTGLTKRRVRAIAEALGVPTVLITKTPRQTSRA
jgi:NAD+ synthase